MLTGSRSNLNDSSELAETEKHLKDIQEAYKESVKRLEVGIFKIKKNIDRQLNKLINFYFKKA
jgi:flagellin-specific chaperone FliS